MSPENGDRMANSVDPDMHDQTALGLHCFIVPICPKQVKPKDKLCVSTYPTMLITGIPPPP